MEIKNPKVFIVLPAYNAEKTLSRTIAAIPCEYLEHIILVDDSSHDRTVKIAHDLGLEYFVHAKNLGYGGNQKTCYQLALARGADIVVMLHPDYQYDPQFIPYLVAPIENGHFDLMLGSRITSRKKVLAGGMPLYKYIANRFLTFCENIILGLSLSEYHTGYRAYSRRALEIIPYEKNSNDFVFDSEVLIQASYHNLTIGEIFVPTKYFPNASSINFKRSLSYGIQTLFTLLQYLLAKSGLFKGKLFS
jgi:glycosyltransferase involved in cell wall biosynthesis